MEQVAEKISYQGVSPWMIPVAVVVGIVACIAFANIWKVVQINREEKKRKRDEITKIAEQAVKERADKLADEISKKVMESMQSKLSAIDRKLDSDKIRLENAEKRSKEHDDALDRIEKTLDSVDANIRDIHEGFTYLARGTIATLNHQRHNGNAEELDKAAVELNTYLTARPVVPIKNQQIRRETK